MSIICLVFTLILGVVDEPAEYWLKFLEKVKVEEPSSADIERAEFLFNSYHANMLELDTFTVKVGVDEVRESMITRIEEVLSRNKKGVERWDVVQQATRVIAGEDGPPLRIDDERLSVIIDKDRAFMAAGFGVGGVTPAEARNSLVAIRAFDPRWAPLREIPQYGFPIGGMPEVIGTTINGVSVSDGVFVVRFALLPKDGGSLKLNQVFVFKNDLPVFRAEYFGKISQRGKFFRTTWTRWETVGGFDLPTTIVMTEILGDSNSEWKVTCNWRFGKDVKDSIFNEKNLRPDIVLEAPISP